MGTLLNYWIFTAWCIH